MIFVGVSSRLPPPIWKTENEQGWQVSHCASDAADLHRLVLVLDDAEQTADGHAEEGRRQQHDERQPGRAREQLDVHRAAGATPRPRASPPSP